MSVKFENITPDLLFELAKEAIKEYPIDLSDLNIDENEYLRLVSIDLLDKYSSLDSDDRVIALLSSNVALILENFLLNLRLLKLINGND